MLRKGDKVKVISSTYLDGSECPFTEDFIGETVRINSIVPTPEGYKYYISYTGKDKSTTWFSKRDLEKIIDINYKELPIGTKLYSINDHSSMVINGYSKYLVENGEISYESLKNYYTTEKPEAVEMTIEQIAKRLNIDTELLRIKE